MCACLVIWEFAKIWLRANILKQHWHTKELHPARTMDAQGQHLWQNQVCRSSTHVISITECVRCKCEVPLATARHMWAAYHRRFVQLHEYLVKCTSRSLQHHRTMDSWVTWASAMLLMILLNCSSKRCAHVHQTAASCSYMYAQY